MSQSKSHELAGRLLVTTLLVAVVGYALMSREEKTEACLANLSQCLSALVPEGHAYGQNSLPSEQQRLGINFPDGPIEHGDRTKPLVAITVDDCYINTESFLENAKKEEVPLTFFCAGEAMANLSKETLQQMVANHELGNHTFSHTHFSQREIIEAQEILNRKLSPSYPLRLFRPPYAQGGFGVQGQMMSEDLKKIDYQLIMYSLDANEAKNWNLSVPNYIEAKVQNGDIILLHTQTNAADFSEIVSRLRQKGFTLTTVSGLFCNK